MTASQTACGPEGEPAPAPLTTDIAIPLTLYGMADALRWHIENALRAYEQYESQRGDAILYTLVDKRVGLAYLLQNRLAVLEQTVTGAAP